MIQINIKSLECKGCGTFYTAPSGVNNKQNEFKEKFGKIVESKIEFFNNQIPVTSLDQANEVVLSCPKCGKEGYRVKY